MKSSVYKRFINHDLSILIRFYDEMLLPFLFSQLLVLTIADPFHKYPYVFLLDVGNEEIEKTEAEQIRLTIPGGSMAVKYPATSDGDLIGHVRVSGIDFGSDLKASIVEGGPGYKYVVIVFSGNPGNSYDAVITIQSMNNEENESSLINTNNDDDDGDGDGDGKDLYDNDNSIENSNESESMTVYRSGDSEVMQSSSNVYKYAVNEEVNSQKYLNDESSNNGDANEQNNDLNDSNQQSDNNYAKDLSENDASFKKISGKYTAFKPHFYGGVRFYPQAAVYTQSEDEDTDVSVKDDGTNRSANQNSNTHPDIDYASIEY